MASISGSIPNLIGGISQQPPASRLENTASDLKNAVVSVVSGMRKRPPLRSVAPLMTAPEGTFAYFLWDRGGDRSRHVLITNGAIRVFTLDGVQQSVSALPAHLTYLNSSDPEVDIGFCAVGDTLFVYNRKVAVKSVAVTPAKTHTAIGSRYTVVVENVAAYTDYKIKRNGPAVALFNDDANPNDATDVAGKLAQATGSGVLSLTAAGISYELMNNVISINVAASPGTYESATSPAMRGYGDSIQRFTNLPPIEVDGRLVKVTEDPSEGSDGYYVRFNGTNNVWEETVLPSDSQGLDPATMPHVLTENANGSWTFAQHTWVNRLVGDAQSNPLPSFVGYPVSDLFLLRDRMVILSDEFIVMSEIGNYENFFRTTMTQLLDSDRIDVAATAPGERVAQLRYAMPFNEALIVFADNAQFAVNIKELSPGGFQILPSTFYAASPYVKPVGVGKNILFVDDTTTSAWASVREFMIDEVLGVSEADEITKQVPELIPSGVHRMATSPSLDTVLAFSRGDRSKLFMYSYYWGPEGRIQSSWTYWQSPSTEFINGGFIETVGYLVTKFDGKIWINAVELEETLTGDFQGVEVLLDQRINQTKVTKAYNATTEATTLTYPYTIPNGVPVFVVLTASSTEFPIGTAFETTGNGTTTITIDGVDLTSATFLTGLAYSFRYKLSPIYLRDSGKVPIQDSRVQIRYLSFLYHKTSAFQVRVTPEGRRDFLSNFTGRVIGSLQNVVGSVSVSDGEFRVPVSMEAQEINVTVENDGPFQSRFSSIEWEGMWRPKTRRMTR